MQINVSQLLQEPIGASRKYSLNEVVDITENKNGSKVESECRLLRTQTSILVTCSLKTDVKLPCSRCLSQFDHHLELSFEEEYFPTVDMLSGAALSLPDEPGSFAIDEHHIIDLTEAVRQYTLLAIPMKPLCQPDCTGLYPQSSSSQGACGCVPQA